MTDTYTHEAQLLAWPPTREVAQVLTMTMREDTGWMPRWTGSVECVTTPELLDNPPEYLTLRMARIVGHGFTLADWSAEWSGDVGLMTLTGTTSPSDITATLGGTPTAGPATSIQITMLARAYTHDLLRGSTTIEVTSCEMKLGDLRRLMEPIYQIVDSDLMIRERLERQWNRGSSATAMVAEIIGDALNATLAVTPLSNKTLTDDAVMATGASVLDPIHEVLTDRDLVLWAERPDQFILKNRTLDSTTHTLTPETGLISAEYITDLGASSKTGSMRLVETPTLSHVDVYFYGAAPGYIVGDYTEKKSWAAGQGKPVGTYPYYSTAKPRTSSRQHVIRASIVSHYQYRADHKARISLPGVSKTGAISAVTYKYPEGTAEIEIESATNWTT